MLYHYCDRLTCADIVRDGLIRAASQTLHRDLFGQDKGRETPPLVWLTTNPDADGVILCKMMAAGWPVPPINDLCRIVLPTGYPAAVLLTEGEPTVGIEPIWWERVVQTGLMVGSSWEDWRLVTRDIPAADWLGVEVLSGVGSDGECTWTRRAS